MGIFLIWGWGFEVRTFGIWGLGFQYLRIYNLGCMGFLESGDIVAYISVLLKIRLKLTTVIKDFSFAGSQLSRNSARRPVISSPSTTPNANTSVL